MGIIKPYSIRLGPKGQALLEALHKVYGELASNSEIVFEALEAHAKVQLDNLESQRGFVADEEQLEEQIQALRRALNMVGK